MGIPEIDDALLFEDDSTRKETVMLEVRRSTAFELLYALTEELGVEIK